VKTFWVAEFTQWSEKYATEAIAPVQNKVGQFLSSSIIRNIVAQVKSTINLRRVMDDGKILIVNLAKGRIGEDNMRLLGGMLVTKIQLAAQERQNVPEKDRRDFYLYVDEFQNFANESFASILSEARKFHLNLTVAHQYIEQLDEKVAAAIFGNVGTIIAMRVGGADATAMETEFAPTFTPEDLVNLAKYQIYLKLMVDGVATPPFSANTLAPIATKTDNQEKVIAVSRERYAEPRHIIEAKVLQWSGMEANTQAPDAPVKAAPIPAALEQAVREFEEKKKQGEQADIIPSGDTTSILPPVTASEEPTLNDANVSDRAVLVPAQSIKESSLDLGDVDTTEYLKIRPERLEAIKASIPQAQGKKQRPDFPHTCSRCGKVFNLAIQLDTSRPIYCTDCRPIVAEERKSKQGMIRSVKRTAVPDEKVAAIVRKEDEVRPGFSSASAQPNRPRIIRSEQPAPQVKIVPKADQEDEDLDLLAAIKKAKGEDIVTSKSALEDRAGMTEAISELITKPAMDAKKKRRRSRNKKPQDQFQQRSNTSHSDQKSNTVKPEVKPEAIPTKSHTLTQGDRVKFGDIDL
ncbi:MAG TPA: type IV secretory system conjugative DNA transfer family protein, partial [bacterium]|nr:type IV secretory system conjugative DNA transfer family protein [bacterium]